MRYLLEAVEYEPKWGALWYLARAQQSTGNTESAIASYRMSIELFPDFPLTHYELGNTLGEQGDIDGAMACYRKTIEIFPEYKEAHVNLGAILCDIKKDYEGAIACFRSALEIAPDFAIAQRNLGMALYGLGDKSGALECFRKAVALQPDDLSYFNTLVNYLAGEDDCQAISIAYRTALAREPENAELHNKASWWLASYADADGHYPYAEQAVAWGRRATELEPEDGNHWNTYGFALFRNDQASEAIEALNKSIELSGGSAYDYLFLAMAHFQKQETTIAQNWFNKALASKDENQVELEEDSQLQEFFQEAQQLVARATKDEPDESANNDAAEKKP